MPRVKFMKKAAPILAIVVVAVLSAACVTNIASNAPVYDPSQPGHSKLVEDVIAKLRGNSQATSTVQWLNNSTAKLTILQGASLKPTTGTAGARNNSTATAVNTAGNTYYKLQHFPSVDSASAYVTSNNGYYTNEETNSNSSTYKAITGAYTDVTGSNPSLTKFRYRDLLDSSGNRTATVGQVTITQCDALVVETTYHK